ncbi:pentatricopeptide repeat-containing protein, mitochondrial-like protein isoform X1 [Cinnamomum micranthum f. kanehirae]|uniref:Pentatricopeptide repeat-containing protein, mitochondrial-like protein isoform X1 n=1 Tax=Cinnamomum micranthum f. kanehirae TaxID=337451 RepID=A0A3S3MYZ1_9MAGN|nr:pentatricopeptide repeat-containing protein, mitochondrial-like protein isoform X1 [Cinnamomum micranthum f. kanehirae]
MVLLAASISSIYHSSTAIAATVRKGVTARINHHSTVFALYLRLRMNSTGIVPSVFTLNILLNYYYRLKRVDLGFAILGDIFKRGFEPDVVTHATIIDGLRKSGKVDIALEML